MDKQKLKKHIEKLRKELKILAKSNGKLDFNNEKIIKKSQELDNLLNLYLNYNNKNETWIIYKRIL